MLFYNKLTMQLCAFIMLVSTSAFAGDMPIENVTIDDSNNDAYGGTNYEIDKMLVNWDNEDQITVDIYTNFGSNNNKDMASYPGRKIILGDLLIGTNGANADFNYAFSLGKLSSDADFTNDWAGDYYYKNYKRYYNQGDNSSSSYRSGGLYAISETKGSTDYHTNGGVMDGAVFGDISNRSNKAARGTWGVQTFGADSAGFDILSFSFNVANIEAFQNASQLSLSWAMSCYNDAVTATIGKTTSNIKVPLPATSLLLLLALTFLFINQRKQPNQNVFSA